MRKKTNTMKDIMINIIKMKGGINMKKTERDHTEKEAEKEIQEIKDTAMKEDIINPEEITGTTTEIKEILKIREIVIIIEIEGISEIEENTEIEVIIEVIRTVVGINQEIISHIQKEMKNIMMFIKMIQETGNHTLIKMIASKMILKEKIVMIAKSKSQRTLMLINIEINIIMRIKKKKLMVKREMEARKVLVSVL